MPHCRRCSRLYERKSRMYATELPTLFDKHSGGGGGFGSGAMPVAAAWGIVRARGTPEPSRRTGLGTRAGVRANLGQRDQYHRKRQDHHRLVGKRLHQHHDHEGNLPEGLKGKVTTKVKAVACPDAQGKVEVEFESTSDLAAGNGSAQTKVSSKLVKHLDDDANLIDDDMDSDSHVEQSTGAGSQVDVTDTLSTSRGEMGSRSTAATAAPATRN